ncbi:MAG: hypothetical protein QOJ49_94, partial [Actinomycetota bacterium]|nr:hypothetical protein [Actinomycetota bacterium]
HTTYAVAAAFVLGSVALGALGWLRGRRIHRVGR